MPLCFTYMARRLGRLLAAICRYVLRIWHAVMLGSNLLNRESCFHWARAWGICVLWCYEIVHQYLLSVSMWGIGLLNDNTNTGTPATVLDIHICIPPSGPGSLFPHKGIYLKIKLFKCRCSISYWSTDNNPKARSRKATRNFLGATRFPVTVYPKKKRQITKFLIMFIYIFGFVYG